VAQQLAPHQRMQTGGDLGAESWRRQLGDHVALEHLADDGGPFQ
jgi:hypothetical protein